MRIIKALNLLLDFKSKSSIIFYEGGIKMISLTHIDDFMSRLGLEATFTETDGDYSRDYISSFDPELNYQVVVRAINSYTPYRAKIVDNGSDFVQINDDIYVEGNKVSVSYLVQAGENGFGTRVKIMVKSVQCPINGIMKSFLGFGGMKEYLDRIAVESE